MILMTEGNIHSQIQRRGLMFILSSPSGAGKTSIAHSLLSQVNKLDPSISVTTRPPRENEVEGKHYQFLSERTFQESLAQEKFLEHAHVFGNWYGTLKKPVMDSLKQGRDVLFDIDWQGTQQLKEMAREDVVSVFILPPSWGALVLRLKNRAQDSETEINRRMKQAINEVSHWPEYDYVIVNEDLEASTLQVQYILNSERLKRSRQLGLAEFVKSIQPVEGM